MFAPAVKEQLKARVAIDGPTGAGKTWTALQWARIIAGPEGHIGLVDTENRSAAYYAPTPGNAVERLNWWDPPYEFGHLPVGPPYDPRELTALIRKAGTELGADGVLVIDSLTHYWSGEGGTRDIVDHAAERARGNSFAGWKEGTPAQRMMLDAIIHAACHVIVTMRSKMEYVLETNAQGKQQPRKIGMAPEQRAGVEYEFTLVVDMDLEHRLIVSKSRCDAVADAVATQGRSADVAQTFAAWLGTGAEPAREPSPPPPDDAITPPQMKKLRATYGDLGIKKGDDMKHISGVILGAPIETHSTLTVDQASALIDRLTAVEAGFVEFVLDDNATVIGLRDAEPGGE